MAANSVSQTIRTATGHDTYRSILRLALGEKTRRDVITPPCTKIETCSNTHMQRIFHMLVELALSESTAYVVRSYRACPR